MSELVNKINEVQKTQDNECVIEKYKHDLQLVLPKNMNIERIMRISKSAINKTPKLRECDAVSVITAVMTSMQLGLEPNNSLGQSYIIPYGNQAQFQIGYQGLLDLAYRSGQYKNISAYEVYKEDQFDFELGTNMFIRHIPSENRNLNDKPVYYYAVYELVNGGRSFKVMHANEIEKHKREYSKSTDIWRKNYIQMALKTVLTRLLKTAPKSIEFSTQISTDNKVSTDLKDGVIDINKEQ